MMIKSGVQVNVQKERSLWSILKMASFGHLFIAAGFGCGPEKPTTRGSGIYYGAIHDITGHESRKNVAAKHLFLP